MQTERVINMKRVSIIPTLFLCIATAFAGNIKPEKGSRDAAVQLVGDWLQAYYKAPTEPVTRVAILKATDVRMIIQANLRHQVCTLTVKKKDVNANALGWLVEQHNCTEELH